MILILNIDTAVDVATISLAKEGQVLFFDQNAETKESASWLHPAIQSLFTKGNIHKESLSAIAVSAGPGSYTGLRVGMAAAKGLCYAWNLPLICINTLKIIAKGAENTEADLIVPIIDARRMEVFTAVYNRSLDEVVPTSNVILSDESFKELRQTKKLLFCGNGSKKFMSLCNHPNAIFEETVSNAENMSSLSYQEYLRTNFSDLAYSEPLYGKEFYSPMTKVKP